MLQYLKKLATLAIALAILVGIPLMAGNWGILFFSWIPALFAFMYLADDEIEE